jgi:hypothetical protein
MVLACVSFPPVAMSEPVKIDSFPEILLCVDSAPKSNTEKLVYAYIEGKKTGCMTLRSLQVLIDASRARKDSVVLEEKNREARKVHLPDTGDIVDRIAAGKKDLAGVDLHGRDLISLNFSSADLGGANLESADLRNAKLKGANLKNANLKSVFLRSADLRGADLTGANLESAIFTNADLRGALGLSIKAMKKIRNLSNAKLDSLIAREVKEEYPEKFEPTKKCWNNSWAQDYDCSDEDTESDQ